MPLNTEQHKSPFRYASLCPARSSSAETAKPPCCSPMRGDGNNSRLVAPRRFGKTSLLRRVLQDAQDVGWATVYVDFFGVLTLTDIAERIERAYSDRLAGRLASWFSGARRMLRPPCAPAAAPYPAPSRPASTPKPSHRC